MKEIDAAKRILKESKTVAVLGAHVREHKPAHYVPEYLNGQGYEIIPVNPSFAGQTLWGVDVLGRLPDIGRAVDVVDVFRRSDHLLDHLDDILAMDPLPKVVWLQSGIQHDEFAAALEAKGIEVIQNRCMLADHQAWFSG